MRVKINNNGVALVYFSGGQQDHITNANSIMIFRANLAESITVPKCLKYAFCNTPETTKGQHTPNNDFTEKRHFTLLEHVMNGHANQKEYASEQKVKSDNL